VAILLGIDPRAYLRAAKGVEREVIAEALQKAQKGREIEIQNIGIACANALGKMLSKKRK
jgi:hypothetical protein